MKSQDNEKDNRFDTDIEIGIPNLKRTNSDYLNVCYPVKSSIFPDELCFSVSSDYEDFIADGLDCALVALILPAMKSQSRIILNGPVSEKLLLSCRGNLQHIVKLVLGYEPVPIIFKDGFTRDVRSQSSLTATGFSGGVDSYSILRDFNFRDDRASRSVDFLIFSNVGANGKTSERSLFEKRLRDSSRAAQAVGLPLLVVESNLDDFYSIYPDLHFFKTHSFRNASVAHLLSNSISVYLYAAARTYSEVKVEPSESIGKVDPITLPMLSGESIDIRSEGARYSRSEKIESLLDYEVVQENLFVCVDHKHADGNCSVCQKCVRTLLVIDMLGCVDKFSRVFDLERYYRVKNTMLVKLLSSNDSFAKDIRSLINRRSIRLPLDVIFKIRFFYWLKRIKASMKSVLL